VPSQAIENSHYSNNNDVYEHILVLSISGKVSSGQSSGGFGEELLVAPTTTQRFDELNGGDESLPRKLSVASFGLKGITTCINHFDIGNDAGSVAFSGQIGRSSGLSYRALLRGGLLA
jgi:hypothetical protein